MKNLVLIPTTFPYNSITEVSFITPELAPLSKEFDRVIVAPILKNGPELDIDSWPENVIISESLVIIPSLKNKLLGLLGNIKILIKDIIKSKGNIRKALAYTAYVGICFKNLKKLIRKYNLEDSNTIFYTFWFDFTTAACTLIPKATVITRTHGHDLYEERYYISPTWRIKSLERIVSCFTVAKMAHSYLSKKYPQFKDKIKLSRLGTVNLNQDRHHKQKQSEGRMSERKALSLLGISRLSPEKGMIRQFKYIIDFAKKHPDLSVSYSHIGNGIQREDIEILLEDLPGNLSIILHGEMHNREVHKLLTSNYFDAIILLSYTEGGCPIALCEAISYGIPAIATDVGGIPEIFSKGGGIILPDNSLDSEKFDSAIMYVATNRDRLGDEAREIWESEFNARILRENFAKQLAQIIN